MVERGDDVRTQFGAGFCGAGLGHVIPRDCPRNASGLGLGRKVAIYQGDGVFGSQYPAAAGKTG